MDNPFLSPEERKKREIEKEEEKRREAQRLAEEDQRKAKWNRINWEEQSKMVISLLELLKDAYYINESFCEITTSDRSRMFPDWGMVWTLTIWSSEEHLSRKRWVEVAARDNNPNTKAIGYYCELAVSRWEHKGIGEMEYVQGAWADLSREELIKALQEVHQPKKQGKVKRKKEK